MDNRISRKKFIALGAATMAACVLPDLALEAAEKEKPLPVFPSSEGLVLRNCTVLDVDTGKLEPGMSLVIRDGAIRSAGKTEAAGAGVTNSIDLQGRTVIPGFIDAHCHSTIQSCAKVSASDLSIYLAQLRRNFTMQSDAGVTTIRDMGCLPLLIRKYGKEIRKGTLRGPRIVHCNAITNIMGSHPEILPSDFSVFGNITAAVTGHMAMNYRTPGDLRKKLKYNLDHGASLVKLTMDNRSLLCGRGGMPQYSGEDLRWIFNTAAKHDRPVSAHILMKTGFLRALDYPMHSMEHVVSDVFLSDEEIRRMADKKIAIVPTAIIGQMAAFREAFDVLPSEYRNDFIENELRIKYDYISSDDIRPYDPKLHRLNMESVGWLKNPGCHRMNLEKKYMTNPEIGFGCMKYGYENLRKMKDAGILIGAGTDAGVTFLYHGTIWREIEVLTRIGFSNIEAIRCATINNAKILRMSREIGSLKPGKFGDLAVLRGNPLEKIEFCRRPLLVMRGGAITSLAGSLVEGKKDRSGGEYRLEG